MAAYLVDADEPILVDARMYSEDGLEEFRRGLDELGYEPADIEHILLTHSHTDHVGQIQVL